jgi:hypothetical protein
MSRATHCNPATVSSGLRPSPSPSSVVGMVAASMTSVGQSAGSGVNTNRKMGHRATNWSIAAPGESPDVKNPYATRIWPAGSRRPADGCGRATTFRSASRVPQCHAIQSRDCSSVGPRRRILAGMGRRTWRSNGQARLRPINAAAFASRASMSIGVEYLHAETHT